MTICFSVPKDEITVDGSRRICIYIPLVIPPWWKEFRNPGGPIEIITDDWIRSEQISKNQARDLSILATMHELMGQLSPQIKRSMEEPISQAFKAINLPTFATLSLEEHTQKA